MRASRFFFTRPYVFFFFNASPLLGSRARLTPLPPGVTQFLADNDLYRLWNWFDDRTWYEGWRESARDKGRGRRTNKQTRRSWRHIFCHCSTRTHINTHSPRYPLGRVIGGTVYPVRGWAAAKWGWECGGTVPGATCPLFVFLAATVRCSKKFTRPLSPLSDHPPHTPRASSGRRAPCTAPCTPSTSRYLSRKCAC
jgi:hypothetical protein